MNLEERYQRLLTCSELIDTRDHLPLFRSLTGRILEIGCNVGNSTTAFLVGESESVTSIDINPKCAENFPGVEKWRFICGDSQSGDTFNQVGGQISVPTFDVLYVDGAHDYESAKHDLAVYSTRVRSGGLVLVHDVLAHDTFPGVWRAFNEFRNATSYGRVVGKYLLPGSYGLGVIEL
jgi:predicted O-methyltransferase YrrM